MLAGVVGGVGGTQTRSLTSPSAPHLVVTPTKSIASIRSLASASIRSPSSLSASTTSSRSAGSSSSSDARYLTAVLNLHVY